MVFISIKKQDDSEGGAVVGKWWNWRTPEQRLTQLTLPQQA